MGDGSNDDNLMITDMLPLQQAIFLVCGYDWSAMKNNF
jgi:hypothetical protein